MTIVYQGTLTTGQTAFDSDIHALEVVSGPSGDYVLAANGVNGGLTVYEVLGNGQVVLSDTQVLPGMPLGESFADISVAEIGGDTMVLAGDTGGGAVLGAELSDTGTLGGQQTVNLPNTGADIAASTALTFSSGTTVLVTANQTTGALTSYTTTPTAGLQPAGTLNAGLDTGGALILASCMSGANGYVLAADSGTQGLTSYRVNATTGTLQQTGQYGQDEGLGASTPTDLETVEAFGTTWAILAASGSSSLSVFQLEADGDLVLADHSTDTLGTRFGQAQAVSVFEAEGQVFVIAGGTDGGMSLFSLLPDGTLLYRETIVHQTGQGLEDITDIETVVSGDEVQILVSSESAPGLAQYSMSLSGLGVTLQGAGTLTGTADDDILMGTGSGRLEGREGDDVLYAGPSGGVLAGGSGADTFVLQPGAGTYVIEDFTPGTDRLDLSLFPMLRSPAQLDFQQTATGARIDWGQTVILIDSHNGAPLSEGQIWPGGFDWADRHHFDGATQPPWPPGDLRTPPSRLPDDIAPPPPAPAATAVPPPPDKAPTFSGTSGSERIKGKRTVDDFMQMGGGNDDVWDRGGHNYIDGGSGNDKLSANAGNDTILGATGSDTLVGLSGNDRLFGEGGDDTLWADLGADRLSGGNGRDIMGGGGGNDTLHGGAEADTLYGGGGNDLGAGEDGSDEVWLGGGADTGHGGGGNDTIGGGDGNDLIVGDSGNDLIYGGYHHDTLFGGSGADTIWAGPGNDQVDGGGQNDEVGGGDGHDTVRGGLGDDTVWGGAGDDYLYGDSGNDTLDGEAGYDVFVFGPDHGNDRIERFSPEEDYIALDIGGLDFGDITITSRNGDALILTTQGEILLPGVSPSAVDDGDILFY